MACVHQCIFAIQTDKLALICVITTILRIQAQVQNEINIDTLYKYEVCVCVCVRERRS